uniref:Novel immune-type receptor 11.1 n=1 Tax=Danio rerio TaxID=7955 RepID=Q5SNQ2_DANRE|nr:novel immune-type receptor 11a precursor [Danio rerio]CAI21227.1 novel immune-type receptor 11.1 [Danio rerio]|eukprot:NP_001020672.1 novel immune-type receptor 11a precursor [Danio rerio]
MVRVVISALLMGLLSSVKSSQTGNITAQPVENVTIWCKHNAGVGQYIHWFKQTHGAVPLGIVCMMLPFNVKLNAIYLNNFLPDRFVMSLNRNNTSLSILNMNINDSGHYFCGWGSWKMMFGDGIHLNIEDLKSDILKDDCPGNIFYNLTFIFDADRHVTHHGEAHSSVYAALRFSKQKTRRAARQDTDVVFSATR